MRISVTGGEGFIGSHLVERLIRDGHQVRALAQYNSFDAVGWLEDIRHHPNLEVVLGDVRDAEQMQTFAHDSEVLFHLASLIAIPYSYSAPQSYFETNVLGTMNVLNAARRAGVRRLVHTSTSEVYGTAKQLPISESHPLQAQSPYSASKISADALTFSYWSSFDLPAVILRPFNTFGPRQSMRAVIPTMIVQALTESGSVKLGSTTPTRDFTYIEDTVDGFVRAMEASGVEGETINLGTGYDIPISELLQLVQITSGRELSIALEERRLRPEKSEVDCLRSDNSKAANLLDWTPKFIGRDGLLKGLEKTTDWLRTQIASGHFSSKEYVT